MEMHEIRSHWDSLARKHGLDLKSTTKTPTIKQLEINALGRAIGRLSSGSKTKTVLEVGCGNGHNIFGLSRLFQDFDFHGVDYSQEMVAAAQAIRVESPNSRMKFDVADVLNLADNKSIDRQYDFVFTDRLLINLNSWDLQKQGIQQLVGCVKKAGHLILVENFCLSYANQNRLRALVELPARNPDPYNKFIEEDKLEDYATDQLKLKLLHTENFGSLHDIILYVLLPSMNGGKVVYDHPLMECVTTLLERLPEDFVNTFGNFGQNKLYVFEKL